MLDSLATSYSLFLLFSFYFFLVLVVVYNRNVQSVYNGNDVQRTLPLFLSLSLSLSPFHFVLFSCADSQTEEGGWWEPYSGEWLNVIVSS